MSANTTTNSDTSVSGSDGTTNSNTTCSDRSREHNYLAQLLYISPGKRFPYDGVHINCRTLKSIMPSDFDKEWHELLKWCEVLRKIIQKSASEAWYELETMGQQ
jgi:hypothetical protein